MRLPKDVEEKALALSRPLPKGNPRERLVPDARWEAEAAKGDTRMSLTVAVSIATPNPLNGSHGHWHQRAALARQQVKATLDALEYARLSGRLTPADYAAFASGCTIQLRRVCPSPGLADDAIQAALKHVRDAVAQWLLGGKIGEKDSDPRIRWGYEQSRLGKTHGVIITLGAE